MMKKISRYIPVHLFILQLPISRVYYIPLLTQSSAPYLSALVHSIVWLDVSSSLFSIMKGFGAQRLVNAHEGRSDRDMQSPQNDTHHDHTPLRPRADNKQPKSPVTDAQTVQSYFRLRFASTKVFPQTHGEILVFCTQIYLNPYLAEEIPR